MFRVCKIGNGKYGAVDIQFSINGGVAEDIENLAMEGMPVLIVDEIEEVEIFGIDIEDVEIIEQED